MSDETTPLADPLPTTRSTRPVLDQAEIRAGSVMAILVYTFNFFCPFFWVVPLLMSGNRFALYHAKQGLTFFLVCVVPFMMLMGVGVGSGYLGILEGGVLWILVLGINAVGLLRAIKGQVKPLPIIGSFGEWWFGNVDVKPSEA
jgi:uncharacterized membrane protein